MNLVKENWTLKEIAEFNNYLEGLKIEEKLDFTKRVINTNMDVLAIPIPVLRNISKEILKGNYISFLENNDMKYYENTLVSVFLFNKIDDIETKKHYISKLVIDNWSTVDAMKFKIKGKEEEYLNLAIEYIKSKYTFIRRIGVRILFNYTEKDDLTKIFKIIDLLYDEEEYYVNMAVAWLMCEIMIKNRKQAINYFEQKRLNQFTINKTVSKCRDSFRVSKEDKEYLLKYKIK